MSVISDFHTVEIYTGKNKPSDDTQRLCVITFKTEKKKATKEFTDESGKKIANPDYDPNYKKPEARCVSIPKLKIHVTPSEISDAMQTAFEDLQDALIRKLIIEKLEKNETILNFHNDQIGFTAIAAYAAEVAASGKLTKEAIHDWFDNDVADALTLAIANVMKMGDKPKPEEEKRLAEAVTLYRTTFGSFAAPKAGLSKGTALQMQKALNVCSEKESRVFRVIDQKIKDALEEKDPVLMGL